MDLQGLNVRGSTRPLEARRSILGEMSIILSANLLFSSQLYAKLLKHFIFKHIFKISVKFRSLRLWTVGPFCRGKDSPTMEKGSVGPPRELVICKPIIRQINSVFNFKPPFSIF